MSSDVVAFWEVSLSDGKHNIEFEHGTTTGKRVIKVDGKEIFRKDWIFKLVGKEYFNIGKATCCIMVEAVSGFAYEYSIEVNGKALKKFKDNQSKIMKAWELVLDGVRTRVVLEKDTLDVWVNGNRVDAAGEFTDDGTETHFTINTHNAYIRALSSGVRREGIIHCLVVDELEIPPATT